MPNDPAWVESLGRPKPEASAASAIEAVPVRDPLDVLQLFRKPRGGDDLAVFGLTATDSGSRCRTPRVI